MRYAVLSDIHGNGEALTAVLDRLATERIDRYVCLGDTIGYGADPIACLERLQRCQAMMVAGNHELGCVGTLSLQWFNEAARAAVVWTREQLSVTDLDSLRQLPLTATEDRFTLVHAMLRHPERFEYLVDTAHAIETMAICPTLMCLTGHTHAPLFIEYDAPSRRVLRVVTDARELADVSWDDTPLQRRYLVNPGSVGQPRDGDPRASYAVIDTQRRTMSVHRMTYDVAAAQRKIRAANLPAFFADRLALGR